MISVLEATQSMLNVSLYIGFVVIGISLFLMMYQIIKGPNNANRAVALDTIAVNLMAIAGLLAIYLVTDKFNDIILMIGILAFLGTLAIAKFYEEGVIIDRD